MPNELRSFTSLPLIAAVWALPALFTFVGWCGSIVGPRSLVVFGILGFLGSGLALVLSKGRATTQPQPHQPVVPLAELEMIFGVLVFVCLIVMFATSRSAGVADYPALAWHPVYKLNSHGHYTTVSRLRYIVVSASFSTGWHSMAMLVSIQAIRTRFGITEGGGARVKAR